MKTSTLLLIAALIAVQSVSFAQTNTRSTAAVANPSVQGMALSPEVAAKMLRIELLKTGLFQVWDEFDMDEALRNDAKYQTGCYGVMCLSELGNELNVNYVFSGSIDKLADRIVINIKVVDVKNVSVQTSLTREFSREDEAIQRMFESMLCEMYQIPFDPEVLATLQFNNGAVVKESYTKINNTGPRMGAAYMMGGLYEFANRPESQGGLDIAPVMSLIGYQFEWQYVGTENFSALVECVVNFSGMEQGRFIPSVDILNGFRFGTAGWEFGFGPGFGITTTSQGFFDEQNTFGKGADYYFSEKDWESYSFAQYGEVVEVSEINPNYSFSENFDARGDAKLNTFWIFAAGRTFRAGSLNIPVNAFYTLMDDGGYAGVSFGFNVVKK